MLNSASIFRFKLKTGEKLDLNWEQAVELFMYALDYLYDDTYDHRLSEESTSFGVSIMQSIALRPVKKYLQKVYDGDVTLTGESPELGHVFWNDLCDNAQKIVKAYGAGIVKNVVVAVDSNRKTKFGKFWSNKADEKWLNRETKNISINGDTELTEQEELLLM